MLYHVHVPWITGGFVGVDIFFVISGFLITSILLKDLRAERFSIAQFYERRIRRICPAFFTVMVCTLLAGLLLYDATTLETLGTSAAAATGFVSNVFFAAVWLFRCARRAESLTRTPGRWLLRSSSTSSSRSYYWFLFAPGLSGTPLGWSEFFYLLTLNVVVVTRAPGLAFYLVPMRAWELMLGSVLATGILRPRRATECVKS